MMLNSQFELSKIERKNKSCSIKLSKIESRKRNLSCHSRKSRVEREFFLSTLENREWKENFLLPLSKIESRKRNGKYQIFEIEREISLSTLDFSLESETLVNAWLRRQWSSSGEDSYIWGWFLALFALLECNVERALPTLIDFHLSIKTQVCRSGGAGGGLSVISRKECENSLSEVKN